MREKKVNQVLLGLGGEERELRMPVAMPLEIP